MDKKTTQALEIGAGVAAAAAIVGAGYYFYASPEAKKHRQAASKWATGLKRSVIKEAKKLGKLDAKSIARIVDDAAMAYEDARNLKKSDLTAAMKELKSNWKLVAAEAGAGAASAAKSAAKRAAPRKSVKKRK